MSRLILIALLLTFGTGPAFAAAPSFTADQAQKGADLYIDHCLRCHGAHLSDGQVGAPIRGAVFQDKWAGKPLSELVQFMNDKMPPDNPGYLYPDELADVTAYILQKNNFKAGDAKLPEDISALKDVVLKW